MATELSLISANRRPSASVGGAMTSWTTPPVDTQRTVGALGCAGRRWRGYCGDRTVGAKAVATQTPYLGSPSDRRSPGMPFSVNSARYTR